LIPPIVCKSFNYIINVICKKFNPNLKKAIKNIYFKQKYRRKLNNSMVNV